MEQPPKSYAGAVRLVHIMFLSFGGFSLQSLISQALAEEAIRDL